MLLKTDDECEIDLSLFENKKFFKQHLLQKLPFKGSKYSQMNTLEIIATLAEKSEKFKTLLNDLFKIKAIGFRDLFKKNNGKTLLDFAAKHGLLILADNILAIIKSKNLNIFNRFLNRLIIEDKFSKLPLYY